MTGRRCRVVYIHGDVGEPPTCEQGIDLPRGLEPRLLKGVSGRADVDRGDGVNEPRRVTVVVQKISHAMIVDATRQQDIPDLESRDAVGIHNATRRLVAFVQGREFNGQRAEARAARAEIFVDKPVKRDTDLIAA